jgi:cellulose synthase operon protein B
MSSIARHTHLRSTWLLLCLGLLAAVPVAGNEQSRFDRPSAVTPAPEPLPSGYAPSSLPDPEPAPAQPRAYRLTQDDFTGERLDWLDSLTSENDWRFPVTDMLTTPTAQPVAPVIVPPPPAPAAASAAAPTPLLPVKPKTVASLNLELPLRRLIGRETSPAFTRSWSVDWPVSHRLKVARVQLRLVYAVSGFSTPVPGVITIGLNRTVVGQVAINPDQPFNLAELDLPVASVLPGQNRLEFLLSVASQPGVRAPGQTEPFLQIDATQSVLKVEGDLRSLDPKLVELRDLVRNAPEAPYSFHIAIPATEKAFDDTALQAGALVTQAIAVNLRDQPFLVSHSARLRRGVDNIVVGESAQIDPFREAVGIAASDDAFIAIRPLPGDPTHFLLLVGGPKPADVLRAAGALARAEFGLPATQVVRVGNLPRGVMPAGQDQRLVIPGTTVSLGALGMEAVTLAEEQDKVTLPFFLPGDFQSQARDTAHLRVDLAQASPQSSSNAIKVYVNGLFAGALTENETMPETLSSRAINTPASLLKPGQNEIVLQLSENGGAAQSFPLTLLTTSSLAIPASVGGVELPDLKRFSQALYPFPATPDGGDLGVQLTDGDPRSVDATWTLLGRMAQIAGGVLSEATLSFNAIPDDKNLVVIGLFPQIPEFLRDASPLRPLPDGRVVFHAPTPRAIEGEQSTSTDWLDRMLNRKPPAPPEPPRAEELEIGLNGQLYEGIFLVQFRSPAHEKRAVLLFTGSSPEFLHTGAVSLLEDEVWGRLKGGLAFWQPNAPASLVTIRPTSAFMHGEVPPPPAVNPLNIGNRWIIIGAIILGLILLGLVLRLLLGMRKQPDSSIDDL